MSESITKELRQYVWNCPHEDVSGHAGNVIDDIADRTDRIDARFDREMQAKQEEVNALRSDNADLQARLDASILPPVDIDGARWTGEDVDKPFALTDGDKATEGLVREIVYDWPREGWFIVDQHDAHYPADRCRHVAPEPPETIEDVRKSKDDLVAFLAQSGVMGWKDLTSFAVDFSAVLERAYECGMRDSCARGGYADPSVLGGDAS